MLVHMTSEDPDVDWFPCRRQVEKWPGDTLQFGQSSCLEKLLFIGYALEPCMPAVFPIHQN